MALNEALLTEINDRTADSAELDQTGRMCRLILLYTLHKRNSWSPMTQQGLQS